MSTSGPNLMNCLQLVKAMSLLQDSLKPVKRNRVGGDFDWADLPAVLKAVRPKMRAVGLMEFQSAGGRMDGAVFVATVNTRIVHVESGEWTEGVISCPCPPDRLEYSATVTLLRRVGLSTLCGLTVREQERAPQDGKSTGQRLVESRRAAAGGARPVSELGPKE